LGASTLPVAVNLGTFFVAVERSSFPYMTGYQNVSERYVVMSNAKEMTVAINLMNGRALVHCA
jgi:hypothetical protein